MVVTDEFLVTSIVDAQPESVIWFKPIMANDNTSENAVIDFEVRYCNQVASQILNNPKELIIGQKVLQTKLLDDQSKQLIFEQCSKVWNTGVKEQFTYYNQHLGKYFNVLRSKVVDGVISVTRDFTAEVTTQNQLKQQADLLNSILDASINAVFACSAIRDKEGKIKDLRFLKFNKMFLQLTNRKEEELSNCTYLTCFPSAKELFEMNCSVVESGNPIRKEVFFKGDKLDGWFDVSLVKLGEDGLVVTFADVTEIRKNKESILAFAHDLQNAIDTSQTGITVIVPVYDEKQEIIDFRYKVVNQTFSKYIGKSPAEMTGQLLTAMFPSYKAQGTFERYRKIFLSGEPDRFDLHYVKDGYDVWADIMAKKVDHEIFVTFHDYTPLKKAQLQLESMVKDLKHSNTNLEDFAYAASHDLQEPLRKIHFFADKIKRNYAKDFDEESLALFERMEGATQRMRQLIDDLLVYSQINLKPKEDENIDMNEVVQEVINDLEATIQEKNARITTDLMPILKGDKPQLRQMLQNLISNALKYVYPDRTPFISISAQKVLGRESGLPVPADKGNENYYAIKISDNGIGFDSKDADRIFNVFQRLHGKAEYSGTGVGLAIVKKVVDNHMGFINAEGKPGEGACFTILLPV